MMIKIRPVPARSIERNYLYEQPYQLYEQTGYIACLTGTLGSSKDDYESVLTVHWPQRVTRAFLDDFCEAVTLLRSCKDYPLHSRDAAAGYCFRYQEAYFKGNHVEECGFRLDTDNYTYLVRLMPRAVEDNFQIQCYRKDYLSIHLAAARKGIPFLDPVTKKEMFRVADGDYIQLESSTDGTSTRMQVRYWSDHADCAYIGGMVMSHEAFAVNYHAHCSRVIPIRNTLPKRCYAYREEEGCLAVIVKGENFMNLSHLSTDSKAENLKLADAYNANLGITKAQVAAMIQGCKSGWQYSEADPTNYDSEGNYKKEN